MPPAPRPPLGLALFLTVGGLVGLVSAFALTLEKFAALSEPTAALGCDFSVIVQCSANLSSSQGEVFGFPNPLIGIAGFTVVSVVGAALLAGARFARWFWLLVNLGLAGAMVFVGWLVGQSIYVLGTLCPWCMVVWAVTIPLFLAVTLYNARSGSLGLRGRARRSLGRLYGWVPFITLLCYILIAVLAQLRLDVLAYV